MYRELQHVTYLWERAKDLFAFKAVVGYMIGFTAFLVDPTQYMALLALFFLCIADFLFGVAAAKKTGMQITSSKFARTPFKLVIYFLLIACAHVAEAALPGAMAFLDETIVGFLAATELLSIMEKAGYLGYAVPRSILNQLHRFTEDGKYDPSIENPSKEEKIIG